MPTNGKFQRLLSAYGMCVALGTLLLLSRVISSPSESANAILFGYSAPRLIMAAGLLVILGLYAIIVLKVIGNQSWAEQFIERWFGGNSIREPIGWLSGFGIGLGWIGCQIPNYRTGPLENYWARIQLAMALLLLISTATWILFIVVRNKLTFRTLNLAPLKLGLPIFIPCLLLIGWMFYSGFGVKSFEDFWYGAGVPILTLQLMVSILGGIVLMLSESKWQSKSKDLVICSLIFALTAYLWAREPLNQSFLFTGPTQPNNQFYPFADAASFDLASQFPLIGENFFIQNSLFFERPLYLSLLVYLHSLAGQNYETMMALQAGLFAILPVLIYLIGKSINLRSVGLGSALVATFRGINSIAASNMIDMANPKMILTDFPAAIGVALVVLFLCEWLKAPKQKQHYPAWIGCAIGLALMLRTNALILLVFVPLYAFLKLMHDPKRWLKSSLLIVLGVIAITLPWEFRNLSLGGQIYGPITTKFQNVIKQRYPALFQTDTSLLQSQRSAVVTLKTTLPISMALQEVGEIQDSKSCDTVVCFSVNHFLHNTLTSILILPTSPVLDDLRYLIRDRYPYYWKSEWDGTFEDTSSLFLIINLFFLTTGVAVAWQEKRLVGLAPLAIFIAYNISNGLARTSGGRYIVPTDWIIPIYYILGFIYFATWLANTAGMQWTIFSISAEQSSMNQKQINHISKIIIALVILFGLGWLIPLSENLHQPRYQNISPMETLEKNRKLIEDAGLTFADFENFTKKTDASLIVGRVLYPRYYKMDQGAFPSAFYPYNTLGFPRIAFKVIGSTGDYSVILPGDMPEYFPHASDALVLGCKGPDYLDAVLVIILSGNKTLYKREPVSKLECPLQKPVCDNNSVCQ